MKREKREIIPCTHCQLPVPTARIKPDRAEQFCCDGCEMVYNLLHEKDLEFLYRESLKSQPKKNRELRTYAHFDGDKFLQLYAKQISEKYSEIELFLEGIHCAACVWLLEKLPLMLPGVKEARVDFRRSLLRLTWEQKVSPLSEICTVIDRLGYPVSPARWDQRREAIKRENRKMLIKIAISGAAAGNIMLISFALYGGYFTGIAKEYLQLFRWFSLILTVPALFFGGSTFFRSAIGSLMTKRLHIDVPIALGITAGFIWGAHNTITGRGEIYFDSVTALIFFLLVGRWIQRRQQQLASEEADLLHNLTPAFARKIVREKDKETREILPVEALTIDDIIEILPGEPIPADGQVIGGKSELDLSFLTGESRPIEIEPPQKVYAGALNLTAPIKVRVQKIGLETRLGQIVREIEETQNKKARIELLADKVAIWFTGTIILLAIIGFSLWLHSGFTRALDVAISLLIVCCPCALALATPLTLASALGRAAKEKILIKGGELLEILNKNGTIWLDKTGTLTERKLQITRWFGEKSLQIDVALLEKNSSHHIADAFVEQFLPKNEKYSKKVSVTSVREITGGGIEGIIDGRKLTVGSPKFIERNKSKISQEFTSRLSQFSKEGLTPVLIAVNGEVKALAGLRDRLRKETLSVLQSLKKLGWKIGILSGDHQSVVDKIAAELSISPEMARGQLSPEEKSKIVDSSKSPNNVVVMVGDGVNDASALLKADVGIAVYGGAEASLKAADIYISKPGLLPILQLFNLAHRTKKIIAANLTFSLLYNSVGATLALMGKISPLLAAILMPMSSLTVISIAYLSFLRENNPTLHNTQYPQTKPKIVQNPQKNR